MQDLFACSAIVAPEGVSVKPEIGAAADPEYLTDYSDRDKPWDVHRAQADHVASIYGSAREFRHISGRVHMCSDYLGFGWKPERDDPGTLSLRLRAAHFCRVRHCPICQWRRSLMWIARFLQALPSINAAYPTARFLFLTLTARNVEIEGLREALREMNKAWDRLMKRRGRLEIVQGWIRTTEVTRAADRTAHPHFHVLLMVPAGYFKGGNYISQAEWADLWGRSLRATYAPIIDIRVVKGDLQPALRETLKYAVKPGDMMADPDWFLELHRQVHKLRFLAAGGVLKDVLRQDQESNDDLLLFGDDEAGHDEQPEVFFRWNRPDKRYKRASA